MPVPTLTDAQARTLAKAIARASSYDRDEPARELAGDRAGGFVLLWMLQERGLVELGKYPDLWDGLAEQVAHASAMAVAGLLRTVGEEEEDDDDDDDDDDSDDDDDDDSDDSDDDDSDDDDSDDDDDDDDSDDDDDDDDSDDDDDAPGPFDALERRYGVGEDDEHLDPWTGFWSEELDRIVLTAFLRDPSPFDGLDAALRPHVARGLASVRLRAGHEVPEAMVDALMAGYARMLVHGDGGPSELLAVEHGALVETPFFDEDEGQLGPHVQALVERLGGEPAWRRHVLAAALSANGGSLEIRYAHAAFAEIDDARMPYLLSRVNWSNRDNLEHAYEQLLLRRDPPAQLMAHAEALGDGDYALAADVCRTCAVLRFAAEGQPVPASVDALLALRGVELGYPRHRAGFVGLPRLVEALQALGPARATALLRARLDASLAEAVRALPVLSAMPEPALVQRALEVVGTQLPAAMDAADDSDVPIFAWGLLGDAALEGLAGLLAALPEPTAEPAKGKAGKGKGKPARAAKGTGSKARLALHRALLTALAAKVERDDGTMDPRWDRWLALDALPGKDEPWAEELGPCIRHVLRRLRPQGRTRLFEGWVERSGAELPRVFALVDLGEPRERMQALERLATAPEIRCDRKWMESTTNRLGVAFHEPVRDVLRRHPGAEARWVAALGRPLLDAIVTGPRSESAEGLRKAAAKQGSAGPHVTIHVLEPWDGVRADASVVSRVGPTALGVPKERWPLDLDGEPLRHMLTLRLADVPELAARHPGKVALAVFLAHDGGHAYEPDNEDAAVLLLDEADLAHGPLDLTSDGDGDDDDDDLDPYVSADTRPFMVVPVEVPLAALQAEEGTPKALRRLHEQIEALPARAGGPPGWLHGEAHEGRFVLQLDDDFETLPVQGRARLYVFDDAVFWQAKQYS